MRRAGRALLWMAVVTIVAMSMVSCADILGIGDLPAAASDQTGDGVANDTAAADDKASATDGPCDAGQATCDGVCVDLQSSAGNCGTCGHVCAGGTDQTCTLGRCLITLYSSTNTSSQFTDLAVQGSNVYWSDTLGGGTGQILWLDEMDGGVTVLAPSEDTPTGVAIDSSYVYWATPTFVRRVPLVGGSPTTFDTDAGTSPNGVNVLIGWDEVIYPSTYKGAIWAEPDDEAGTFWNVTDTDIDDVARIALAPPGVTQGAWQFVGYRNPAADGGSVFAGKQGQLLTFNASQTTIFDMAADTTAVYWPVQGHLRDISFIAGEVVDVVTDAVALSAPRGIALDTSNIYWTNGTDTSIYQASKGINVAAQKIAVAPKVPNRIVNAGGALFFTTPTKLFELLPP